MEMAHWDFEKRCWKNQKAEPAEIVLMFIMSPFSWALIGATLYYFNLL